MARKEVDYCRYTIPENVTDGGTVMGFKMRNVIEGCIMGGIAALLAAGLPIGSNVTKVSVVVVLAAPFIALGAFGLYGDPVSKYLVNFYHWMKQKQIILYNGSARLLDSSPVDVAMEQKDLHDRIVEIMDARRKRAAASDQPDMVEGIDFTFEEDRDEKTALAKKQVDLTLEYADDMPEMESEAVLEDDSVVFEDITDVSEIS